MTSGIFWQHGNLHSLISMIILITEDGSGAWDIQFTDNGHLLPRKLLSAMYSK